jgi:hypothetical protein
MMAGTKKISEPITSGGSGAQSEWKQLRIQVAGRLELW